MFFVPRCHPPSESPEDTPHSPFGAAPPQKGGAAHPPGSGAQGRFPSPAADGRSLPARGNTAALIPGTSALLTFDGHRFSSGAPGCHRAGQNPGPVFPPPLWGRGYKVWRQSRSHHRPPRSRNSESGGLISGWASCHRERDSRPCRSALPRFHSVPPLLWW